ncbi:hypothetical protein D3C71_1953840 [compost metagenome]
MNHSAAAREISLQRAMRVSPIRVPWHSIIRASMASPGALSKRSARSVTISGSWTPRRRAGLGMMRAVVKSANFMPAIGLAGIRSSLCA